MRAFIAPTPTILGGPLRSQSIGGTWVRTVGLKPFSVCLRCPNSQHLRMNINSRPSTKGMGEDGWLKDLLCVPSLPNSQHFETNIHPWPTTNLQRHTFEEQSHWWKGVRTVGLNSYFVCLHCLQYTRRRSSQHPIVRASISDVQI